MAYLLTVPERLKQAWGEEVVGVLSDWLVRVIEERAVTRDEHRQILSRLDMLEHDVEGLRREVGDLRFELREFRKEVNERFDRMNERFDRMNERFDRMNERFDRMMKWTVGVVALFGTLITVIWAIG